jgi:hypothetical protein
LLAELLALISAITAGELLWVAPPVAALFEVLILDRRLDKEAPPDSGSEKSAVTAYWPYLYPLVAAACATVIGIKLVGRVLPYHMS